MFSFSFFKAHTVNICNDIYEQTSNTREKSNSSDSKLRKLYALHKHIALNHMYCGKFLDWGNMKVMPVSNVVYKAIHLMQKDNKKPSCFIFLLQTRNTLLSIKANPHMTQVSLCKSVSLSIGEPSAE